MLGNDIIDIELTRKSTDWTRSGWLDKICTLEEQDVILRSQDPFRTAWRIWSIKESAYKLSIQKGYEYAFNPSFFQSKLLNDIDGKVYFGDDIAETITTNNEDYIHSIATMRYNGLPHIQSGIVSDQKNLKPDLLEKICKAYSVPIEELEIRYTDEKVPFIYNAKRQSHSPVSMSHHGKYGAYAFYKQPE